MCIQAHTTKNPCNKDVVDRQIQLCLIFLYIYLYGLSLNGRHTLFRIVNNRHGVTITTHAIKRHFLIWMTTVRHPTKRWCSCVLTFKFTFICVYWWTRQRIHNTLFVVDRYLRLMGDKTIPDSAEPRFIPHSSQVSIYHIKVYWILIIYSMAPTARCITYSAFSVWITRMCGIKSFLIRQSIYKEIGMNNRNIS